MKNILGIILLVFCLTATAQEKKGVPFNGLITDLVGTPIKRAKIYVKSPKIYTYSDKKGRFGLTDVKDTDTLTVVYKKQIYTVLINGRKSLKLRLGDQLEANEDEELISLGYGYVTKREFLNSGNQLSGEELRASGYTSIMAALRGRVPGLNISGDTALGGSGASVNIRGINSIYGSSTPLFLLDDVEVTNFDSVNMNDVDHIEILKDANMYGVKGANGVIKVYLRKK